MNKLIFEIEYIPTEMGVKVSDFMSKCDLGIERITNNEVIIIKTKAKLTKKYIDGLKKIIIKGFEISKGKVYKLELKEKSKIIN